MQGEILVKGKNQAALGSAVSKVTCVSGAAAVWVWHELGQKAARSFVLN